MTPVNSETLVEVGAEGGSISLVSELHEGGSQTFWVKVDESGGYSMLDEEDLVGLPDPVKWAGPFDSFDEAIQSLDRYNWVGLYPLILHPDVASEVLIHVSKRGTVEDLFRWERAIQSSELSSVPSKGSNSDKSTSPDVIVHETPLLATEIQAKKSRQEQLEADIKERHIDFLLQEEITVDRKFADRFVRAAAPNPEQAEAASSDLLAIVRFLKDNEEGIEIVSVRHSVADAYGEADLIVVFKIPGEDTLAAVLIEDKVRAPFQKEQPERYKARGEAGLHGSWDCFWTCLVAPSSYLQRGHSFDTAVDLERIKEWFRSSDPGRNKFKTTIIEKAIAKAERTGVNIPDSLMSIFRNEYHKNFQSHFQNRHGLLSLRDQKETYAGDTWFRFDCKTILPKGAYIEHKAREGEVCLTFPKSDQEILKSNGELTGILSEGMFIQKRGGSSAISLRVPRIDLFVKFDEHEATVRKALEVASQLLDFYEKNSSVVDSAVSLARAK